MKTRELLIIAYQVHSLVHRRKTGDNLLKWSQLSEKNKLKMIEEFNGLCPFEGMSQELFQAVIDEFQ